MDEAKNTKVRLPNNSQRTVLVGRTGTGKTVAGLWHLSNYDLSTPWVLLNFKDDEHIESIEKAQYVDFDFVPDKKDSGLYVVNVMPVDTKGAKSTLEVYLEKLWARRHVGIFVDEAFMVGNNDAFEMNLTQGRSRRIPMIICTQRPCWISRFAFSEADFVQVFHLNDDRDRATIEGFTPLESADLDTLAEHQSFYYDIAKHKLVRMNPVPNMDVIRGIFDQKLYRKRQRI